MLKKYTVTITETLKKKVIVMALNSEEAERIIANAWLDSAYILDSSDFADVDFKAEEAANES